MVRFYSTIKALHSKLVLYAPCFFFCFWPKNTSLRLKRILFCRQQIKLFIFQVPFENANWKKKFFTLELKLRANFCIRWHNIHLGRSYSKVFQGREKFYLQIADKVLVWSFFLGGKNFTNSILSQLPRLPKMNFDILSLNTCNLGQEKELERPAKVVLNSLEKLQKCF